VVTMLGGVVSFFEKFFPKFLELLLCLCHFETLSAVADRNSISAIIPLCTKLFKIV
jgi:hypothetical protein